MKCYNKACNGYAEKATGNCLAFSTLDMPSCSDFKPEDEKQKEIKPDAFQITQEQNVFTPIKIVLNTKEASMDFFSLLTKTGKSACDNDRKIELNDGENKILLKIQEFDLLMMGGK